MTFRLADSLPQKVLASLRIEQETWLVSHPSPWSEREAAEHRLLLGGKIQQWLDNGHGSCLLGCEECRRITEDTLVHFSGVRYDLYAFVVMPNHVHALFQPKGMYDSGSIVKSWKSYAARKINALRNRSGILWQKESYDTLVRSESHFQTIVRYIKNNNNSLAWSFR